MATLTGQTILSTYQSLLKIDTNGSLSSTLTTITDGLGNISPLSISTTVSSFTGSVGIGSTTPGAFLEIKSPWNGSYKWLRLVNTASNAPFDIIPAQVGFDTFGYCFQLNGVTQLVGGTATTLIGAGLSGNEMVARLGIRGGGSTSATNALLIQNSSATNLLRLQNDGGLFLNNYLFGNAFIADLSNGSVTIGSSSTANASSVLDMRSTTKGFLPPRMTNSQRTSISSPSVGLIVYCTDAVEGLYIYKSTGWTFVI
jgi:hypothetical protein